MFARFRRRRRGERGAIAAFTALVLVILLGAAAFVVDLGMQRVGRSDMQALADVVALDLARDLNGTKTVAQLDANKQSLANASRDRNKSVIGYQNHLPELVVTYGTLGSDSNFVPGAASDVPTAVQVKATTNIGFVFSGVTGRSSGGATRSAVATSNASACFRVGSFIASLDSAQSALLNPILNSLLGSNLNLGLIGYKGLAGANVSLLELVEVGGLGVGSVDELLKLKNVSAATLFVAAANVLDRQGNAAQADILRAIQVAAGTPNIAIGDLIEAAPGDSSALTAGLNVLDLLTTAAFVSNKDHAVEIPNLGISLPGLTAVTTTLSVIESPRTKCGPIGTVNETAQIRLDLTGTIPARTLPTAINTLLNTNVSLDATTVSLSIDLGKALATLNGVTCDPATGDPSSLAVGLRSSVVGGISLNASTGVHAKVGVPLFGSGGLLTAVLDLLGLGSLLMPPELEVDTTMNIHAGTTPDSIPPTTVNVPLPGGYDIGQGSGSGPIITGLSVTPKIGTEVTLRYFEGLLVLGTWKTRKLFSGAALFDYLVNPIAKALTDTLLNPLLTSLQNALIAPLSKLLGLQLGGADVFAVRNPTCAAPRLRK